MEKMEKLNQLINEANVDSKKFYEKGNKAAGTRLRAAMLQIKKLTLEIRKDVSAVKNESNNE